MDVFISYSGGRPMKPISDDVPTERARLAQALRDLLKESVPEGVPTDAIARAAGIGRSTLFHALSGQRVPSFDTVLTFVNACQSARTQPDFIARQADGSVVVAEAKSMEVPEATGEKWKALWEQARHPDKPKIVQLASHGMPESTRSSGTGDTSPGIGVLSHYMGLDLTSATKGDEMSVADARADLDRALRALEDATRNVAHAQEVLQEATAREKGRLLTAMEEAMTRFGISTQDLRAYVTHLNDHEPPADAAAGEESAR
ncbi:helix-turn-helix domain-containing protein [Streptomyces tauricus]|uniref:hypothetical protein n=1 Tax=Streptomyces tauricus TaxID=68274 RepID=UPI0037F75B99